MVFVRVALVLSLTGRSDECGQQNVRVFFGRERRVATFVKTQIIIEAAI